MPQAPRPYTAKQKAQIAFLLDYLSISLVDMATQMQDKGMTVAVPALQNSAVETVKSGGVSQVIVNDILRRAQKGSKRMTKNLVGFPSAFVMIATMRMAVNSLRDNKYGMKQGTSYAVVLENFAENLRLLESRFLDTLPPAKRQEMDKDLSKIDKLFKTVAADL